MGVYMLVPVKYLNYVYGINPIDVAIFSEFKRLAQRFAVVMGGYQSLADARCAPSTMDAILAQQIDSCPTRLPSPQSVPASTFSLPTSSA